MSMTQSSIAVGVFHEPAQAQRAIEELRQAGYSDDEIGFLARATTKAPYSPAIHLLAALLRLGCGRLAALASQRCLGAANQGRLKDPD